MLSSILATVVALVVSAVVGVIGKAVNDWSKRKKVETKEVGQYVARREAIEAIEVGVARAQQQIVDSAKALAASGDITSDKLKDELKKAEKLAINTALEIATGPAAEYLTKLATDTVGNAIGGLIDLVLGNRKAKQ